jgi:hypothetical protein
MQNNIPGNLKILVKWGGHLKHITFILVFEVHFRKKNIAHAQKGEI